MSGLFIVFEGGEGAGKSSLIKAIDSKFREELPNVSIVLTREPGGSRIGTAVRDIILHSSPPVSPRAEALLFAAERAQHVEDVIAPALALGKIVLCDRFVDSSIVYQGVARGLGSAEVESLSTFAAPSLNPDMVILLDIDPEVGIRRKEEQKELNNMELESLEFHKQVREEFLNLASNRKNMFVLDASRSQQEVADEAWSLIIKAMN